MAASAPPPTYKEFSQLLPSFLLLFSFYGFFFLFHSSLPFYSVLSSTFFVLSYTLYFSHLFSFISLPISLSSSHIPLFSFATYFLCLLILSFNSSTILFSPLFPFTFLTLLSIFILLFPTPTCPSFVLSCSWSCSLPFSHLFWSNLPSPFVFSSFLLLNLWSSLSIMSSFFSSFLYNFLQFYL